MDQQDWTPWMGYRKLAVRLAVRLPLAGAMTGLALLGTAWVVSHANPEGPIHLPAILVFLLGLGVGGLEGWIVARGLVENTGLCGMLPLFITAYALLMAQGLAGAVLGLLSGDSGGLFILVGMFAAGSIIVAARTILIDS